MKRLYLGGVGLLAPGLPGWRDSVPILNGALPYRDQPPPPANVALLPANERRRTTAVIKLALHVAQEALGEAGLAAPRTRAVFASSGGDMAVLDNICNALNLTERPVSPVHFHNSVHNAPAGYWAIATGCAQASVSLSAYDASFSAGLLEAATLAVVEQAWVLLIAYDQPGPEPLAAKRPLQGPCGVALALGPRRNRADQLGIECELVDDLDEDRLADPALERLRLGNPAARGLALLRAVALGEGAVVLPYLPERGLRVRLSRS